MFINVAGKNIHYNRQGRGESILLVHGWGGTINSLKNLADILSKKFETITIDLPGFGQSDLPEPNWSVPQYSSFILDLIKKLELKKISYLGHSFGGSLGIYLASHHPEIMAHLILADSSFKRSNKTSYTIKNVKQNILSKLPLYHIWEASIKKMVYKLFFPNSDLLQFPQLETNFRKIMTEDLTPYISQIKVPTLILWGEEDTYTPIKLAHELKAHIPHSTLITYPDIRHNLPIKYPELIAPEIEKFLKS